MLATCTETEEEAPSLLWGLNPIFSAFARLYVKDIQEMKESKQVPGIFFYNRHPIRRVDILGTVVLAKERDAFHIYGVDDSTGVISCICWKNPAAEESAFECLPSTSSNLDLLGQIRKLQDVIHKKTKLQIGDTVRVRGCIRIYRQQREIKAFMYYKVDDPVCDAQISRMLELPRLYRDVYDKPFQFPEEGQRVQGATDVLGSIPLLSEKIRHFLLGNKIQSFYQQELETVESLVLLVKQGGPSTPAEETDSKASLCFRRIRNSFVEAIKLLQEKGVLFQKSKNPKDVYYVTEQDRELHRVTLEVIKADCKRPKYAEKGCHLRHILSCVQLSYSPYVTQAVIRCLLDWMETNSDIVTTMEEYYTVF
ncbi:CST complex subunit STN1 [Hemicordylus capensis]|uniref:CST complex subunit STN1 n=1 Tax=Hemicordylus capensis TaxID=884348 RepID=UPI002302D8D9|nr:CST complex subunit STN1 [Hemicordylus capensis]XP_053161651.1 CST complex subunit STN1 [Hemicordylus capensis]XP_053161652.1 CST complex subunit STN1 [Hemicordylus capensis]XP_053161653.1 CST complex subunit STN1 [Hemicordylus capensis]XP_053161654.1 CST complex subunit STN1 [Hemicordylus capensis]XP_053161655.1 CST complex subunit STN1 [Hemicordylus capensis]XP_053161657.1 CST complex subunit STN1 [Hemicordylus capensis]XP_053161658.1 CST complex subunit STN1 [Hemicordylus capensis]